jgi:hypothetical protein
MALILTLVPTAALAEESTTPEIKVGSNNVDLKDGAAYVTVPVDIKNNPGFAGMDVMVSIPSGWTIPADNENSEIYGFETFKSLSDYGILCKYSAKGGVSTVATVESNNKTGKFLASYKENITNNGTIFWVTYQVPAGTVSGDYTISVTVNKINTATETSKNIGSDFTLTSGTITVENGLA